MGVLVLQPKPNLSPEAVVAVIIGAIVAVGTCRQEFGKVSLPDGGLIALLLAAVGFWAWVFVSVHHSLVVTGRLDGAAARL